MSAARLSVLGVALCFLACGSQATDGDGAGTGGSGGVAPGSGGLVGSGGALGSGGTVASGGSISEGSGGTASGGAGASGGALSSSGGAESTGGAGSGGEDSGVGDGCPFSGHVEYQLNDPEGWPSDVTPLITAAMDGAIEQYNCYADLTKTITVNYNPGVPTAEANVDGWLSFGADKGYMQVATAMHEVAHTLGVGYFPWAELLEDGRWIGSNVDGFMQNLPAEERDPDMYSQRDYITGDTQHFWPYGLNQASEHQSDWSLINHVRIVAAMQRDKQAYLDGDL